MKKRRRNKIGLPGLMTGDQHTIARTALHATLALHHANRLPQLPRSLHHELHQLWVEKVR